MYKAIVNAHDLKHINTEPERLDKIESIHASMFADYIAESVAFHSPKLKLGQSLTIELSYVEGVIDG